ncbi:DUF2269 family protein [Kitasatospora purpeofusca]|uniref:DUF2269 family protein n=1 Tax=Kitasatospora purpeofusca TaxID=67352 RepID=UPI00225C24A4|nr:DUF2269 family protein [Kitasatospora purpeofusca]MCX4752601.1 DUF2269 family protein [Kitasatospora purpeofusca]WSR32169.1 DUF2269 family protein [Kitasatospora purpeofusca]WSR40067.1 DUF2269 family protein [Kitasatospora purpeofusca]
MAKFLLSLHVLASVLFIGPVAVAVSMFPRRAAAALAGGPERAADAGMLRQLHRITQVYALLGIAVPVLGVGVAQVMDVLGQSWLIASMVLTAVAALALLLFVLPAQQAAVDALALEPDAEEHGRAVRGLKLLPMTAGVFNLLWAVVVVLMIVRPGSTTGV